MSVADLAEHCVNLRHVGVYELSSVAVDLLARLGSRIRVLCIKDESVHHVDRWREVFRACTNLEVVHLELSYSAEVIDVISLMRTKLVSLKLDGLRVMDDPDNVIPTEDRLFSVLSACSVLEEVEFGLGAMFSEALVDKLFKSLKSVTTMACNMIGSEINSKKDIIDVIARNLTNLESFTISTSEPLKGEEVNALVGLPHLKSVTLGYWFCEESIMEECAVEVVKRFKDCTQLIQLDIDDIINMNRSILVAEAAAMYNRKDFDMFIGGVQYRTW